MQKLERNQRTAVHNIYGAVRGSNGPHGGQLIARFTSKDTQDEPLFKLALFTGNSTRSLNGVSEIGLVTIDLNIYDVMNLSWEIPSEDQDHPPDAWLVTKIDSLADSLNIDHAMLWQDIEENDICWRFLGYHNHSTRGSRWDNEQPWHPRLWDQVRRFLVQPGEHFKTMPPWLRESTLQDLGKLSREGSIVLDR